jgi:hypothetical protein
MTPATTTDLVSMKRQRFRVLIAPTIAVARLNKATSDDK